MVATKQKQLIIQLDCLLVEYEYYKSITNLDLCEKVVKKDELLKTIVYKYNLPIRCLYSILSYIRNLIANKVPNKVIEKFLFTKIASAPQNFITETDVLIPFEIIERICSMNDIAVSPKCWTNNYFLVVKKSFYVPTTLLRKDAIAYFKSVYFYDDLFVSYKGTYSTTPYYLKLEKELSAKVTDLFNNDNSHGEIITTSEIEKFINMYEKTKQVKFNPLQKEAITKCIMKRSHVVCGFPGTGKSTIFDAIKAFYYSRYGNDSYNISCLAPTGLAVKNLLKKCSVTAPEICGTIHRMAYNICHLIMSDHMDDVSHIQGKASDNTLSAKERFMLKRNMKMIKYKSVTPSMIVIDEFSMVDMLLLKLIVQMCERFDCKLIIMGDENQLPPIGPGNPLYRMANLTDFRNTHVTFLMDIMRQDKELLIDNIKRIKEKDYLIEKEHFDNETMFMLNYSNFIDPSTKQIANEKLVDFITKHKLTKSNTQFLSPENNKNCGCVSMNKILQDFYNPKTPQNTIPHSSFRVRDLVVRTQNCPIDDKGIFANGDIGVIRDLKNSVITIEYDNSETQDISVSELHDEFTLRYCMTIHKSQGGEYENVVLLMGTPHEITSWRQSQSNKLLYTAVSRAKSKCYIISKPNLINICQSIEEFPIETSFLTNECDK